jgi:predicted RNase H-like nuclease (RuvC/YqgF family)
MKGLWILAGLVGLGGLLAWVLAGDTKADLERKYDEAVRPRAAIEESLAESAEILRYFADRKPVERKKGELEELRRRFESLEKSARVARDDESQPREERKKTLARLGDSFLQLKADADDLRARLREMKRFDAELRGRITRLGDLTRALAAAQAESTDPEFQQRSGDLLEEAGKFRTMAETGLKTLAVKIVEGRALTQSALNELDGVMDRMKALLDSLPAPPPPAGGS